MQEIIILLSVLCIVLFVVILGIAKLFKNYKKLHEIKLNQLKEEHKKHLEQQQYSFYDKIDIALSNQAKVSIAMPGVHVDLFKIPILDEEVLLNPSLHPIQKAKEFTVNNFYKKPYVFKYESETILGMKESDIYEFASQRLAEELVNKGVLSFKIVKNNYPCLPEISCGFYLFEKR